MTRLRSYRGDDAVFDARQTAAEDADAEFLHASTSFVCQGCYREHDIAERVIFSRHPEMPAYCEVCACTPGSGGTYP
jgi:ribosomal protein S27E